MRKIGFVGAFDKTDLLLQIAKILTVMGIKTIVIDSTINQKAKYVGSSAPTQIRLRRRTIRQSLSATRW